MNRRTARRANPSRGKCSRSQGLRAIQSRIVRTGRCSLGDSVVRDLATPARLGVATARLGRGRWAAPGKLRSSRRSWPPPDAASRSTRNTALGHPSRVMRVTGIHAHGHRRGPAALTSGAPPLAGSTQARRPDAAWQRSPPLRRRGPAQPRPSRNRYARNGHIGIGRPSGRMRPRARVGISPNRTPPARQLAGAKTLHSRWQPLNGSRLSTTVAAQRVSVLGACTIDG
jgi:hypothetical protein